MDSNATVAERRSRFAQKEEANNGQALALTPRSHRKAGCAVRSTETLDVPLARIANRLWATLAARGFARDDVVTLEVTGRTSGRLISFPLVMAVVDGKRYLVSMLGEDAQWVRNVRAADGRAVLRRGRREAVRLEEVPIGQRAPILKTYLHHAEGARPHIPIDVDAPLADYEGIADRYPVFRVASIP